VTTPVGPGGPFKARPLQGAGFFRLLTVVMVVRPARIDELSRVFRLSYDVTSGISATRHVVACKRDRKLRSGTQYILENDDGEFLSTLTTYRYRHPPIATAIGIANLYTPARLRRRGYAGRLLDGVLEACEYDGDRVFYLLSDIDPAFYARRGFRPLALRYDGAADCVPMLRCSIADWETLSTHSQFLRGLMTFVD
jgi:N-acetylglutamate synthase-like GNAT family acetyltransferase